LRDLQSLEIPQKWQDIFLPLDEVASMIVNGRHTSASVDSIIMLVESVEESVSSAKNAHDDAIDRFHAWLRDTHSKNPFDSKAIKDYQTKYLSSIKPLTAANHTSLDADGYDGDEWYTPVDIIEAAREVLGNIDLDPASCDHAQEIIKADRFYTKDDDSLRDDCRWRGRIWLNPPYSTPLIDKFIDKLVNSYEFGDVEEAIMLTNNSSDTRWFHKLLSRYPVCFTLGRVPFWRKDHDDFNTRQGQAIFYLGKNPQRFFDVFSFFGEVVRRYDNT